MAMPRSSSSRVAEYPWICSGHSDVDGRRTSRIWGAQLAGQEHSDWPSGWGRRFDELTPFYREMAVVPLDPATPRGGRVGSGESGLGADEE
jgi:hypothetical protein